MRVIDANTEQSIISRHSGIALLMHRNTPYVSPLKLSRAAFMHTTSLKIILFGIAMFIATACLCQDRHTIDSLKKELNTKKTDMDKAHLLTNIAFEYAIAKDSSEVMFYSNSAILLYKKLNDPHGIADALRVQAELYTDIGQWLPAEVKFKEALTLLSNDTTKRSKISQANILMNYSFLTEKMGMEKKSTQLLFEAAAIQEKYRDYKSLKTTYKNIGIHFESSGDRMRAGNYYKKSLDAAIQTKDNELIFEACLLNAYIRLVTGDFLKMNAYLDEAKNHYQLPSNNPLWGEYFYLKSNYHLSNKEYEKALAFLKQAKAVTDKDDKAYILNIMLTETEIYKDQANYPKALKQMRDIYHIVSSDTIFFNISSRVEILISLVELEEKNGNFKEAYFHLQQKLALEQRVNRQEMPLKLREMEIKYETVKKDKDILKLQNDNKLQELKLQKNKALNIGLFSGVVILGLAISIGYILFYNKKRSTEKKEIIYLQQIESLKKEQQLINYDAILEGQEKERSRLARDLHDGLIGILSGVVMQLSALSKSDDRKEQELNVKHIIGRMNEAITEVRNIAHNLMPASLEKLGLDNSLRDLCNSLKSEKTHIIYRSYDLSDMISPKMQVTIYRMIQELVVNAIKHSEAKTVLVECLQDEGNLNITVEDDGKGFDENLAENTKGIGIDNIKKRVDFLEGTINIRSLINIGTTIHIQCCINDYKENKVTDR